MFVTSKQLRLAVLSTAHYSASMVSLGSIMAFKLLYGFRSEAVCFNVVISNLAKITVIFNKNQLYFCSLTTANLFILI